ADLHLDRAFGAAVDELVHIFIAAVVDVLRRAVPDDLALVEHGDAVGDFARAKSPTASPCSTRARSSGTARRRTSTTAAMNMWTSSSTAAPKARSRWRS